jgi:hypothetical protein
MTLTQMAASSENGGAIVVTGRFEIDGSESHQYSIPTSIPSNATVALTGTHLLFPTPFFRALINCMYGNQM